MPRFPGFQPFLRTILCILMMVPPIGAQAAQPVAPPGSRVALAPPAGFALSNSFRGFVNRQLGASIGIMEFPAGAFEQTKRGMNPDALARRGLRTVRTKQLTLAGIDTFLLRVEQRADNLLLDKWLFMFDAKTFTGMVVVTVPRTASGQLGEPDVRTALASLRVGAVSNGDPRALLPYIFKRGKRFQYENVLGGHAVLLKETPPPPKGRANDAAMLITYNRRSIPWVQRDSFGRRALSSFKALKVKKVLGSKPIKAGGLDGYEYRATASDPKTGVPLDVVMVVLYSDESYYVLMGFGAPPALAAAEADIQAVIASFRLKS